MEPATVNFALLVDRVATGQPDVVLHAVVAWTDGGEHLHLPLPRPIRVLLPAGAQLSLDLHSRDDAEPAARDLTDLGPPYPASSGKTWWTLALPSVPPWLRHLPPAGVVRELAHLLGG